MDFLFGFLTFGFFVTSVVFLIIFLVQLCTRKYYKTSLTLFLSFLGSSIFCFILTGITAQTLKSQTSSSPTAIEEMDSEEVPTKRNISTPVEKNEIHLKIVNIMLSDDMLGTPTIGVSIENSSEYDVDAFDIRVKCYNKYDEIVRGYGFDKDYDATCQDIVIKAGETKDSDGYWSLYGYDDASRFEVAITRYHNSNDETIEINDSDLVWFSIEK